MRLGLFAALLAATAAAAPPDPLLLTRDSGDVELWWSVDLAASGYEVRRVTDETLLPTIDTEPVHITVPAQSPAFPVLDPGAVPGPPNLYYYSVRSAGGGCIPGRDTDGDRLDDCVETDTGNFVDAGDTGTDPNLADTDGDAINDGDEVLGTLAGLDLPALGVSPVHRDVLIEYDWFDDSVDCAAHSHRPTQAMVDKVTQAFADAPVSNPDGIDGINVIHDFGQGGAFTGGNFVADADGFLLGVNGSDFIAYKLANHNPNRRGYFHYCMLPHKYGNPPGTSSGQAEINGNDFIVSLYCAFSTQNVANTIVHEIGHNFNLRHGGFENCNRKKNYNSVMNYDYQFPGVDNDCTPPGNGVLDYSRGTRIDLDENNLDENRGTCGTVAVDWDGDSRIETGVREDLNPNQGCSANFTVLEDYDDWANLSHTGVVTSTDAVPVEVMDCENPAPGFEN